MYRFTSISALAAIVLITLPGCQRTFETNMSATRFRHDYPAPPNLDEAVAFYRKANNILLERSLDGSTARVELEYANGTRDTGMDLYFSSEPRLLHETRRTYDALLSGDSGCMTRINEKPECGSFEFTLGLRDINPDAIFEIADDTVPCGETNCRRLTLVQATFVNLAVDGMAFVRADDTRIPVRVSPVENQYRLTLVAKPDGEPVAFTEIHLEDGVLAGPKATFWFDLDATVKRPVLKGPD